MLDELIAEPLVINLRDGNHEGVEAYFSQFANKIVIYCSENTPMVEKYSALITLETSLEISAHKHSLLLQTLVQKIVRFIRQMRQTLKEPWRLSTPLIEECHAPPAVPADNFARLPHPKVSTTEAVEYVYEHKHYFFKTWPLTKVIEKVNIMLGTNLTPQQVYANWPNICRRVGDERAHFVRKRLYAFEQHIVEDDGVTDKRSRR